MTTGRINQVTIVGRAAGREAMGGPGGPPARGTGIEYRRSGDARGRHGFGAGMATPAPTPSVCLG